MSAIIHNFVVHQLVVNAEQELALVPRESCYEASAEIENLAQQLNHVFSNKPGKGVGGLENQEESNFLQLLETFIAEPGTFYDFSVQASQKLIKTLIEHGKVETGFVLFNHYQFLATDYLMITLLNTREHVEISRELELSYKNHLDLSKMQLAVRIDLTQMGIARDDNRYVSFIKGLMGRKVSDFFMDFIGCQEQIDIKQQNKQLVDTVEEYMAVEQLDPQEKLNNRKVVSEYYKGKLESGEDISIQELSGQLPQTENRDFMSYVQQAEQPLEPEFQADRAAIKTLSKFSGQGGGISLSFDRKLLGDRISYDAGSDTLMIKGIPPNLKDQLTRS